MLHSSATKLKHIESICVVPSNDHLSVYAGCSTGLYLFSSALEECTLIAGKVKSTTWSKRKTQRKGTLVNVKEVRQVVYNGAGVVGVIGKLNDVWTLLEFSVDDNSVLSSRPIPIALMRNGFAPFVGSMSAYQDFWVVLVEGGLLVGSDRSMGCSSSTREI